MYRKGAQDKKRSAMFSKLSREITVAAKMGLPDPDMNARLRAAVIAAQRPVDAQGQYPALDRQGVGGDAENYEEIRYEGFGPGGVALIVEALTDNRNRTATNVRTAFSKNGGNLGARGSVSHGFERLGLIEYPASAGDADKVFEAAIEAGAEDVESDEDGHRIWTSVEGLHEVARALEPLLGEARRREARLAARDRGRGPRRRRRNADEADRRARGGRRRPDRLGQLRTCPRRSWRSLPEDPRPRPGLGTHRLGADPGRGQPPLPCRQRPDEDRPG